MNKEEIRELAFNSPAEQLNHLVAKHIFDNEVRLMDITALMTDLRTCTSCPRLVASRTQVVTYDGDPNPDVVFVGEAPGKKEDEAGRPFVGPAGQLLRSHIREFLDPLRVKYGITNLVKCRPVVPPDKNGKPETEEINTCRDTWLLLELSLLQPRLVVLLGDYALSGMTDKRGITKWRGQFLTDQGYFFDLFATWHPAALIYDKTKQETFKRDFAQIADYLRSVLTT